MPLDAKTIALLRAEAKAEDVDPAALIAEADSMSKQPSADGSSKADAGDLPPIFDYEAPYVFVKEIRARKGLTAPFPGDDYIAADWKRMHPSQGDALDLTNERAKE